MNKIKIIIACLLILFFVLAAFAFLRIKNKEELGQKTALAQEMRKTLNYLMFDLVQARERSIQYVPPDGEWHNHIAFIQRRHGFLEYILKDGHLLRLSKTKEWLVADNIIDLRIRRQSQSPDIIELQIEAQRQVSLIFNLKVKVH